MKRLAILGVLILAACGGTKTIYVTDTEVPNSPETTEKVVKTTDAPIATSGPEPAYTEEDEFIYDIESNYSGTIYVSNQEMIETGRLVCESLLDGMSGQEVVWAIENAGGDIDFVQLVALSAVANFCPSQAYKFNGL